MLPVLFLVGLGRSVCHQGFGSGFCHEAHKLGCQFLLPSEAHMKDFSLGNHLFASCNGVLMIS